MSQVDPATHFSIEHGRHPAEGGRAVDKVVRAGRRFVRKRAKKAIVAPFLLLLLFDTTG